MPSPDLLVFALLLPIPLAIRTRRMLVPRGLARALRQATLLVPQCVRCCALPLCNLLGVAPTRAPAMRLLYAGPATSRANPRLVTRSFAPTRAAAGHVCSLDRARRLLRTPISCALLMPGVR